MTKQREVVICSATRTPIGTYGGSLKDVPAVDLGGLVIAEAVRRTGLGSDTVQTVVMGNVIQAGNRMNPARQAAIHGGIPVSVPALTVNRVCGSGVQAIASAAQEILLGHADCAVAGGMENMDRAPYLLEKARWGYRMGDGRVVDSMLYDGLHDAFSGEHAGWHTEDLAEKYRVSREDQDAWAARSQQRFSAAQAAGLFETEIVPVEVPGRKGPTTFAADEHNRADATAEGLGKLRPAFRKDGTITAGNAPGLNSGAAALVLTDRAWAEAQGLTPLARIRSWGVGAVDPGMFGIGPVPAVHQALERAGWSVADLERVEINEAFAAIALAVLRELDLSEDVVNVEGGAIAHGHPIGASGAALTVRLLHAMQRNNETRGMVTLCIGGGQGVALAVERLT